MDVFLTGQKASELCKNEAGMHIYKKVKTEGVLGLYSIEDWSEFGLKYVEYEISKGEMFREFIESEKVKKIEIDDYMSEYEVVRKREKVTDKITIGKTQIVNRSNDDVYSELVIIGIHAGWADMLFINLTGTNYSPWGCGREVKDQSDFILYPSDLIKASIIPND